VGGNFFFSLWLAAHQFSPGTGQDVDMRKRRIEEPQLYKGPIEYSILKVLDALVTFDEPTFSCNCPYNF
jgi:hypothetical protein